MSIKSEYQQFIDEIDQRVADLTAMHTGQMACGKGCDLCCIDFDLFPVEFHHMKETLQNRMPQPPAQEPGRCAFLENHACTIYEHRPYICRTHGLPLINMDEEGDEWELSFCELNFTDAGDDYFDEQNVLEQDSANSRLYMMNSRFIDNHPQYGYREKQMIPMRDLLKKY